MDEFNVNIQMVFTQAGDQLANEQGLSGTSIKLPGGAPIPLIGDEVSFIVEEGKVVTFRVSARQFVLQGVLPQLDLILTLDSAESS